MTFDLNTCDLDPCDTLTLTHVTFDPDPCDLWPPTLHVTPPNKTWSNVFFTFLTLTFDLWPWPSGSTLRSAMSMPLPNLVTLGQTVSEIWINFQAFFTQTDRQKVMHKSPPCISTGGLKNTNPLVSEVHIKKKFCSQKSAPPPPDD